MRTEEEFQNERYFGIQKFVTPEEAFEVVSGEMDDDYRHIILDDDTFPKMIKIRAADRICESKLKMLPWDKCMEDIGLSHKRRSDYLLDFDFFLYSHMSKSYYTCRMSFKDDQVHLWNNRQWRYYDELFDLYSFSLISREAQQLVESCFDKGLICEGEDLCLAQSIICDEGDLWL